PALAGELLRKAVSGTREAVARAILAPSWAPATALRRAAEESGMPVGRMLGTYGGAPGGRELSAAIRAALEGAGVEVLEERVKELRREGDSWAAFGESGPLVRARVAIVATGGAAGGGLLKRGRIFAEPGVGGRLVFGRETLRQEAAPLGPGADAFLPARLFGEGGPRSVRVAVDERMRPEGAEDGLYLAGELAGGEGAEGSEGGEEGRERGEGGLAWAVVSGLRAGGEGAEGRGGRGDPTDR
ncbi:MAG: hypothetical protein HY907_21075, partial [Deltaproteobacteria bacterium]|nr:hypothetical protein [Deltaproteobacteria bacterium]